MKVRLTAAILAPLCVAHAAYAVDITLNKNSFPGTIGGQVTGPGISAIAIGGTSNTTLAGLQAGGTYSVDYFHNSGALGSDFTFTINGAGTGVASVGTNGGGAQMVTGFTAGATTLTLNAHTVTFNSGGDFAGTYFLHGSTGVQTSGATGVRVLPGGTNIDHLSNRGGGNEDWTFVIDGSGNTSASPGAAGSIGIPHSEFAAFSGSNVDVRTHNVHYVIDASGPIGFISDYPVLNFTSSGNHYEFDMVQAIGNSGVNVHSFGLHTVTASNSVRSDGTPLTGATSGNDAIYAPVLRYDGTSPADGFYLMGAGGQKLNIATATYTGFYDGNTNPLTMTIQAHIPEPSGVALLAGAGLFASRRRRIN